MAHAHGQRLGIDVVGAAKVGLEVAIAAADGGHLHLDVGPVAGCRKRLVRDNAAAVRMLDHDLHVHALACHGGHVCDCDAPGHDTCEGEPG